MYYVVSESLVSDTWFYLGYTRRRHNILDEENIIDRLHLTYINYRNHVQKTHDTENRVSFPICPVIPGTVGRLPLQMSALPASFPADRAATRHFITYPHYPVLTTAYRKNVRFHLQNSFWGSESKRVVYLCKPEYLYWKKGRGKKE